MSERITVLVNRPSIFWLPSARGPEGKDGARPALCGKLKLIPGTNELSKRRWDMTKDHPAIVVHLKLGTLVVNPSAEDAKAHTHTPDKMAGLSTLSVPKAAVWIEACSDVKQLEKWRNQEQGKGARKGILKAIDARLDELEEDAKAGDGDDAGDDPKDPLADEDFQ